MDPTHPIQEKRIGFGSVPSVAGREGGQAMAPPIAAARGPKRGHRNLGLGPGTGQGEAAEVEELRRRSSELELELAEARAREEEARRELERTRERLRVMEEAEERLSAEFGELEAEAVAQSRAYLLRIKALSDQLAIAHDILTSTSFHHKLVAFNRPN